MLRFKMFTAGSSLQREPTKENRCTQLHAKVDAARRRQFGKRVFKAAEAEQQFLESCQNVTDKCAELEQFDAELEEAREKIIISTPAVYLWSWSEVRLLHTFQVLWA